MGRASRSKRDKRNGTSQHFVPRLYLRGFLDPASNTLDPWLWRADIDDALQGKSVRPRRKGLANVAEKSGYYDLSIDMDGVDTHVEDFYGLIEDRAKSALTTLQEGRCALSTEQRFALSQFMGHQLCRTPRHRLMSRTIENSMFNALLVNLRKDTPENRASHQRYQRRTGSQYSFEEIQAGLVDRPPTLVESHDRTILLAIRAGEAAAQDIFVRRWNWFRCADTPFFTTDQPVTRLMQEGWTPGPNAAPGDPYAGVIYSFVATPSLWLVAGEPGDDTNVRIQYVDRGFAERFGLNALHTCHQYVYCRTEATARWVLDAATENREAIQAMKSAVQRSVSDTAFEKSLAVFARPASGARRQS